MSTVVELLSLSDSKIKYLQDMKDISINITKCIEEDRFEDIEELLESKEEFIKKIDEIDAIFNENISEELLKDSSIKSKLSEIREVLISIKSIDDKYEGDMKKSLEKSRKELKETRNNQRAMQGYVKSDPYQAFASLGGTLFIDEDS